MDRKNVKRRMYSPRPWGSPSLARGPATGRSISLPTKLSVLTVACAVALWGAVAAAPVSADADNYPAYGWGMMGPGMMGGYGGGYGMMGPGMMGGGMMDMMMGGYGGGYGMMGPGMMGGMGMMGYGPMSMLNLTDEQRTKINKIYDDNRKKDWELYGKIADESARLRELYAADTPDAKKIGAAYDKIFDLQRQAIVSGIEAQNKARAVLTKEQQEQLKSWQRGGWGGPRGGAGPGTPPRGGYGPGMMGPGMMGR